MERVEELKEFLELSRKLVIYKFNISSAYSFFIYGSIFASLWLIIFSLRAAYKDIFLTIIVYWALAFALSTYLFEKVEKEIIRTARIEAEILEGKVKAYKYIVSWVIPFASVYLIPAVLGVDDWLIYATIWCLGLGIALILFDYLVLQEYRNIGYLLGKHHALAGTLLIISYVVSYWLVQVGIIIREIYTINLLGINLLIYILIGVRAQLIAEKVFEG